MTKLRVMLQAPRAVRTALKAAGIPAASIVAPEH
jgi:hypothetical protein